MPLIYLDNEKKNTADSKNCDLTFLFLIESYDFEQPPASTTAFLPTQDVLQSYVSVVSSANDSSFKTCETLYKPVSIYTKSQFQFTILSIL